MRRYLKRSLQNSQMDYRGKQNVPYKKVSYDFGNNIGNGTAFLLWEDRADANDRACVLRGTYAGIIAGRG